MSNKNTRYSFSKNNLNAAVAMGKNAYGQTVLNTDQSRGEHLDVDDTPTHDGEFQPHISSSGELVHNQSVMNSPTLQKFLSEYNSRMNQDNAPEPEPEEEPVGMLKNNIVSVTDIDAYAKEFKSETESEHTEKSMIMSLEEYQRKGVVEDRRRFAATTTASTKQLVRFCTECGFSFESEKFCPHCGKKRATYVTPNV